MFSTRSDRERAATTIQQKPLTPQQENQKADRESQFNRGYDAAVCVYLSEKLLEAFDFSSLAYRRRRAEAFEAVDLNWRVDNAEIRACSIDGRAVRQAAVR